MTRLIRANLHRSLKNPLLWLLWLGSAACGLLLGWESRRSPFLEDGYLLCFYLLLAVWIAFTVGRESEGLLRNKLTVGHSRAQLFFAELTVAFCIASVATLLLLAAFVPFVVGHSLAAPAAPLIGCAVGFWLATLSFASWYVMLSFSLPNRAASAVISMLLTLGVTFLIYQIDHALWEPEFLYTTVGSGTGASQIVEPNPRYVGGIWRRLLTDAFEWLPYGTVIRYTELIRTLLWTWREPGTAILSARELALLWRLPLYSTVNLLLGAGCGCWIFQRKNLK